MIAGMRQFLVYTLATCLVAVALWLVLFYLSWPEQDRDQAEPKPQGQAEPDPHGDALAVWAVVFDTQRPSLECRVIHGSALRQVGGATPVRAHRPMDEHPGAKFPGMTDRRTYRHQGTGEEAHLSAGRLAGPGRCQLVVGHARAR